jgi:mannose-6-phosphate isomerase-like protein (cupin superfamily)
MVPDRHMDPYFAEFIPPTREMEPKGHMHPGFEFLYLLDGELHIQHGDQECTLEGGDAVYFDASTPHSYQCAGRKPAGAIIVTMHQAPPALTGAQRAVLAGQRTLAPGPVKVGGGETR